VLVIKKINNNVAICRDGNGRELVAFGKGIGFPSTPYELNNLTRIDRTFYNIDREYWPLLDTIPQEIIEFTAQIVDEVRGWLPYETSPNIVMTLADHIAFAIRRVEEGIYFQMPSVYQLEQDYPLEIKIGKYFIVNIQNRLHIHLPKGEISGIAMQFINSRNYPSTGVQRASAQNSLSDQYEEVLKQTIRIVEQEFRIRVQRDTFNYRRFAIHLEYLLQRMFRQQYISTDNQQMYDLIRQEYPETERCVDQIAAYYRTTWSIELTSEEKLYLMMHVNRIRAKGDE